MRTWLTRGIATVAVGSATLMLGGVAAATGGHGGDAATPLVTRLSGEEEVPGPGDDDGRGVFAAVVRGDTLCYVVTAVKIETATAAHIHAAPEGVAGDIVVGLEAPDKVGKDCITAVPDSENSPNTLSESELEAIVADPSDYYVNVHNARFPAGAIRGQLG